LDVESLFTNVPISETIDIILKNVYNHNSLPPPSLNKETLKKLLYICTTKTPFNFNGKTYIQKNGVSMGSPLGPTFADFYMSNIENKILNDNNPTNPEFYVRYVDDTFVIFKDFSHINLFKTKLVDISCLKFTYEKPKNNYINFLDINIKFKENGKIEKGVYVKSTDKGTYLNFESFTPLNYKLTTIKTLVHRAFKISSNWHLFDIEIKRITQNLVNNNFPQSLIEKTIKSTLNNLIQNNKEHNNIENITLFFESSNLSNKKMEENKLKLILKDHIKTTPGKKLILRSYYKPLKLSSCFPTRSTLSLGESSNVVYQFKCSESGCNATYVGYTTNTLNMRMTQHKYKPSKVHQHFKEDHNKNPDNSIKDCFSILLKKRDFYDLRLAESLMLRRLKPEINIKFNEMSNFLNVYK